MEIHQTEGIMVLTLFLGYLYLWRLKKHRMMEDKGHDPGVVIQT
jgi:hypothetical protein